MKIKTILQDFEWNLPADSLHWHRVGQQAKELAELGFSDIWLPPAYKGHQGREDVGYGVYDLYDLGEFEAKGSRATKYGTIEQYLAAIEALHDKGLNVMTDIVLNHRMGADGTEWVQAHKYRPNKRMDGYVKTRKITAATRFKFPERNRRYSAFKWSSRHFTGTDINLDNERGSTKQNGGIAAVYKFFGHRWSTLVDDENQNYDYLMGCDVDFNNPEVQDEIDSWGKWYMDMTNLDSVRLDAVKHISHHFFPHWLAVMREHAWTIHDKKELFAVGEYWSGDCDKLVRYLYNSDKSMSLFDVPLHFHLRDASEQGDRYDLRKIFDDTLVQREPWHAVTFVDNHDTQPGQMLQSWVDGWFKQSAYALILLRQAGVPCVFYGDLYGLNPYEDKGRRYPAIPRVRGIEKLLEARKKYATGGQTDYFEKANLIGWTREGGAAVVISNKAEDAIYMKHGTPGQVFVDMLGNSKKEIVIGDDGCAWFGTIGGSVSVWVSKE